ncbi:putative WD repeat-containing protein [Pseudozyma hubeiensis]|nr:putative WD repeat-containing protein [Pseudozyma hubeiensis]
MDQGMDFTLSGAARAPALASSSNVHRAKEPFHVQVIPPNAYANASPAYVTHLLSLSTSYGTPTLLAVADDSTLTLIDKSSGVVAESHRAFKDARITQAKPLYRETGASGSFVASVSNGTVACWDTRSGLTKPVWTLQGASKAPYLCVEPSPSDANVVVAGTEQYGHGDSDIDIWDIRSAAAPKSKYNEVHSDDVTVLQYHPDAAAHAGILLSGSTDGLVSAIDTTIAEEDDAVISVGNTGNSVARAGWIQSTDKSSATATSSTSSSAGAMDTSTDGADEEADLSQVETEARRRALGKVWAVGDMQTLSIFDADKFDPILPTTDVRSSASLRPPWSTDYVIDAFPTLPSFPSPPSSDTLTLFVGRSEGAFATISIPTSTTPTTAPPSWGLRAVFPEQGDGTFYGHSDIIRSVEWDPATNTLYTGGEDGNLCFWNFDESNQVASTGAIALNTAAVTAGAAVDSPSSSRSGGSRNATPARSQRYTPYK